MVRFLTTTGNTNPTYDDLLPEFFSNKVLVVTFLSLLLIETFLFTLAVGMLYYV